MTADRKIFREEGPAWIRRAIQICQVGSVVGDGWAGLMLRLEAERVTLRTHAPAAGGTCLGCLPKGTVPWPCAQARPVFRQHRGEVGWRPHWDEHIEETS